MSKKYDFCLLDVDYVFDSGKAVMRIFGRTADGKSVVALDKDFKPYFYALSSNIELSKSRIRELRSRDYTIERISKVRRVVGTKEYELLKIYTKTPICVRQARVDVAIVPGVEGVYEADILFNRRYIYDKRLEPMSMVEVNAEEIGKMSDPAILNYIEADLYLDISKIRRKKKKSMPELTTMAYDIEVYNPKGSPNPDNDPIIMLSYSIGDESKVLSTKTVDKYKDDIIHVDDESDILREFCEIVKEKDVDVLVGYNSDGFDLPYMVARAKANGQKLDLSRTGEDVYIRGEGMYMSSMIPGRVHVDLYYYVTYILRGVLGSIDKRSLSNVASVFLEEGEKKDVKWDEIPVFWDEGGENLDRLFEYSINDAVITRDLGKNFLSKIYEIARLSRLRLFDANRVTYGQLVESYLSWNAVEKGIVIPNKPTDAEKAERGGGYIGAYVHDPKTGLHEDVALLDFKSLYPTIIMSHNIGPSTIGCTCCRNGPNKVSIDDDNEWWFCNKRKGFVPSILEYLITERTRLKGKLKECERDTAEYDDLDNRQYVLKIIANSLYGYLGYYNARWFSKGCAESVTAFGRGYIMDSIKIAEEMGLNVVYGDSDSCYITSLNNIRKDANKFMDAVNKNLPGIMELELEDVFKRGVFVSKKRYALVDYEGRFKIKGLEFVRSDWSNLAKSVQKSVIYAILEDGSTEKAFKLVRDAVERVKKGKLSLEDVVVYTELKRPLEKYKALAPHIAVAEEMKRSGKNVDVGTRIGYVIQEGGGHRISDRAISINKAKIENIDKEYYINKQILSAVSRIMESLGHDKGSLMGNKQSSLVSYLS